MTLSVERLITEIEMNIDEYEFLKEFDLDKPEQIKTYHYIMKLESYLKNKIQDNRIKDSTRERLLRLSEKIEGIKENKNES